MLGHNYTVIKLSAADSFQMPEDTTLHPSRPTVTRPTGFCCRAEHSLHGASGPFPSFPFISGSLQAWGAAPLHVPTDSKPSLFSELEWGVKVGAVRHPIVLTTQPQELQHQELPSLLLQHPSMTHGEH